MFRLARHALLAWLLALYGSVSLCGVGLHALLETGPSHHDHGIAGEPQGKSTPTISGVSTHCPLCEFQTQGQLPVFAPRPEYQPLVLAHVPLGSTLPDGRKRHASAIPRAPPFSVWKLV
jgi:hypothetical protein